MSGRISSFPRPTATAREQIPRRAYSLEEAAQMLGMARSSISRAVQRGEIAAFCVGSRVLIPADAFDRLFVGGYRRRRSRRSAELREE